MSDRRLRPPFAQCLCYLLWLCPKDLVLVGIAVNLTRALLSEPDVLILNGPPPSIRPLKVAHFGRPFFLPHWHRGHCSSPSKAKAKHRLSSRDCFVSVVQCSIRIVTGTVTLEAVDHVFAATPRGSACESLQSQLRLHHRSNESICSICCPSGREVR